MTAAAESCILALDLGTSAFKAAPVTPAGLLAEPVVVSYDLDVSCGCITCPPERYISTAMTALRTAADAARKAGCRVEAIGVSSQAQTFLPVDGAGRALADAVVWLDNRAGDEARRLSDAIPNAASICGFRSFTGQQFLPKVMHMLGIRAIEKEAVARFLLLNEYLAFCLTGRTYGDETSQGMGGCFDIMRRVWSEEALGVAGIRKEQLAPVYPAASTSAALSTAIRSDLGLDAVPAYLCGNDQCCAAAGADLDEPGSVLCNFGTAMVLYTRMDRLPSDISASQIAGIDPLTGGYFLLGLDECGNVLEQAARRLFPQLSMEQMLAAVAIVPSPSPVLMEQIPSSPVAAAQELDQLAALHGPEEAMRALLVRFADRFAELLSEVLLGAPPPERLVASGGLSRSAAWLDLLSRRTGIPFIRADNEHAGLLGVARIIARHRTE